MAKDLKIKLQDVKIDEFCKGARTIIRSRGKKIKKAKAFNLEKLMVHLQKDSDLGISTKAAIMTQCTFTLRFDSIAHVKPKHVNMSKKHIKRFIIAKEKRRHDHLQRREITHVPKNTNAVVAYTAELLEQCIAEAHKDNRTYLFGHSKKLEYGSFNALIKTIATEMGHTGTYSTHSCRRTGANFWLKEGFSIPTICYLGGWKSAITLLHYIADDFGFLQRVKYESVHGPLYVLYP